MLIVIMLIANVLSIITLSVIMLIATLQSLIMVIVNMPSVIMLSAIMPSVIMLIATLQSLIMVIANMPSVIMFSVVMPSVVAPNVHLLLGRNQFFFEENFRSSGKSLNLAHLHNRINSLEVKVLTPRHLGEMAFSRETLVIITNATECFLNGRGSAVNTMLDGSTCPC